MAATITFDDGMKRFVRNLGRVESGQLQKDLVTSLHTAGPKIEMQMKGAAPTKIARTAAQSVDAANSAKGIELRGGGGSGLPAILWAGGEYGGRKPKKVTYVKRSPLGNPYVITRRTTMQFAPHLGTTGWFYWPTVREWIPKLVKDQEKVIDKVLGGR